MAEETKSKAADVLLAPTLNMVRSPSAGRNHETYGEDPFLLGILSACFVNGCQDRGIAATPKHFVANEAENRRTTLDVQVSEKALREIYLEPFRLVMKHSTPLCFMTSYNSVQGEFVRQSKRLIQDVLRGEWGFTGLVISDWGGTYSTIAPIKAGLDLAMPGKRRHRQDKLLRAVQSGGVSEKLVDASVIRIPRVAFEAGEMGE
ncbi:Beta-glucosidase B [Lachnellula occidentalis]|uniref:beta-glucosidase n=1 Tax=Lachnellula occidentalis TaxID=215460 RepID=A0A8H8UI93_9HELO|nr:Beta-glucosidase B [Lachnellula occidentalis]